MKVCEGRKYATMSNKIFTLQHPFMREPCVKCNVKKEPTRNPLGDPTNTISNTGISVFISSVSPHFPFFHHFHPFLFLLPFPYFENWLLFPFPALIFLVSKKTLRKCSLKKNCLRDNKVCRVERIQRLIK